MTGSLYRTDGLCHRGYAILAQPQGQGEVNRTSESVVPVIWGYSDGSTAKVRSRFTELKPAQAPLCMNSQFWNRKGWQLVC